MFIKPMEFRGRSRLFVERGGLEFPGFSPFTDPDLDTQHISSHVCILKHEFY